MKPQPPVPSTVPSTPPSAAPDTAPASAAPAAADAWRVLRWPHGQAELHRRGGMLAPVVFRAGGAADFSPLHVAPWAGRPEGEAWPGLLGGLRGEWPCVPFGRSDLPDGLPPAWSALPAPDPWGHGYAAHHDWQWLDASTPFELAMQIDLPAPAEDSDAPALRRLTRTVRALPDAPTLEIELRIDVRAACTLPVALHPTLRLDLGRVALDLPHAGPGLTYPVAAEPGRSRLAPNARFDRLDAVPLAGEPGRSATGATGDFTRYPQPSASEDLLQLMDVTGPVRVHYVDAGWALTLEWDRAQLPDVLLWISHGGRLYPPWNGRHFALGIEPLCGAWDLGRVAQLPPGHPLAPRTGLRLEAGTTVVHYRLSARPQPAHLSAPF